MTSRLTNRSPVIDIGQAQPESGYGFIMQLMCVIGDKGLFTSLLCLLSSDGCGRLDHVGDEDEHCHEC